MSTKGVIYYNRGLKCIVRLIVSMWSLKRFYDGPITLFWEGDAPKGLIEDLRAKLGVDVVFDSNPKLATLLRKIEISKKAPYDVNVYIDADTVVLGKIDELFDMASDCDLVATHFAGWRSDGGTIARRIRGYASVRPEYIEDAVKYGPAVNTGIYAWGRGTAIFDEWLWLAQQGENMGMYIPDEVACQVLLPKYKCKVAPLKFNVSVKHDPGTEDKRIIHYHGRKHCKEYPLCDFWVKALDEVCKQNLCNITEYVGDQYGDRRLRNFFRNKYGHKDAVASIKESVAWAKTGKHAVAKPSVAGVVATATARFVASKPVDNDITLVTACDVGYVEYLRTTLPNWFSKKHLDRHPMIVYVNGFGDPATDDKLAFLRGHKNVRIVPWDMPLAESQREKMLSAFVIGTARDVTTPYWVKIDADAFANDDRPLFDDDMKNYAICGHRWGYTKPSRWISELDAWAASKPEFAGTPPMFDPAQVSGRRYSHRRTASFIQMHNSDFTRVAAALAGERLPVPSHDTYIWYVATRMQKPIRRHDFKRRSGFDNCSRLERLKARVAQIG